MKNYNSDPINIYPEIHKIITKKAKNYSIIRELLEINKINKEFIQIVRKLSLEDLIAIKLEDSAAVIKTRKFYGIPIYHSLKRISKDAVIKFALSATDSQWAAARFLGIQMDELFKIMKVYKTDNFFKELIQERENNELNEQK